MEGIIHNYRRSRTRQNNKHMIVGIESVTDKEKAQELVGKKVVFTTETGKKITGQVASSHGNKGRLRVIFEKGLPGQSLGTAVEVQ